MHESSPSSSRRSFLKSSAAVTAVSLSAPSISLGAPDQRRLKVGLIGCGGRGGGAAANALKMDTNAELWAMGDVSAAALQGTASNLRNAFKDRVNVSAERQFIGLAAYQKVLESNPDVVILTTPPGFRPVHL